ncbi:hypothetical protein KKH82_01510 [Patescibacteria group bacterium]|nr:hypothetical protein [Patescibacteria group bacterium]
MHGHRHTNDYIRVDKSSILFLLAIYFLNVFRQGMFNLYQSQTRKDIQQKVYKNPTFDLSFCGKKYIGVIKEKKL